MAVRLDVVILQPQGREARMLATKITRIPGHRIGIKTMRDLADGCVNHRKAAIAAAIPVPGQHRSLHHRGNAPIGITVRLGTDAGVTFGPGMKDVQVDVIPGRVQPEKDFQIVGLAEVPASAVAVACKMRINCRGQQFGNSKNGRIRLLYAMAHKPEIT